MTSTQLPIRTQSLWGKSSEDGEGYPLVAHMIDVAACAWEILEREPTETLDLYARDLGVERVRECVCALVGLHDLGKASPAFQRKWPQGAERTQAQGLTWDATVGDAPHGLVTEKCLPAILTSLGWPRRVAGHAASAVGAHHGFRHTDDELNRVRVSSRGKDAWDDARSELVAALFALLGVEEIPAADRLDGAAYMRLSGLTSFADWIGSDACRFGSEAFPDDLAGHYAEARRKAQTALDDIGWASRVPLKPRGVVSKGDDSSAPGAGQFDGGEPEDAESDDRHHLSRLEMTSSQGVKTHEVEHRRGSILGRDAFG